MNIRLSAIVCVPVVVAVLSGCSHKDIVCPGSEPRAVAVAFDWSLAPGSDVDGMTVYFYPAASGSRIWRFDIAGRDGGDVELPVGEYRMIAVNNDLPGVMFSGQDAYDTFTASARRASGGAAMAATGMLYGGNVQDISVSLCGVSYRLPDGQMKECPRNLIRCRPDSLSTVYDVTLRDVKGMERVRSAAARINGVAESVALGSGSTGSAACAASLGLERVEGENALAGSTTAFGTPDGPPGFTMSVSVTRTDGLNISKSFDVTGQVINSPYPRHVSIVVDGMEIPAENPPDGPDDDDVGITVGVDGWQVVEIELFN